MSWNPGALDDKNLLEPTAVLAGRPTNALSLRIQLNQIPEAARQIALGQAEQALQDVQNAKIPGETPAQTAGRIAAAKEMTKFIASVLKEGKELKAEVDLDKQSGDLSASFSLSALPWCRSALLADLRPRHRNKNCLANLP